MTSVTMSPVKPAGGSAIEFKNLSKRFGSVVANDDVCFVVALGTVHGLIG